MLSKKRFFFSKKKKLLEIFKKWRILAKGTSSSRGSVGQTWIAQFQFFFFEVGDILIFVCEESFGIERVLLVTLDVFYLLRRRGEMFIRWGRRQVQCAAVPFHSSSVFICRRQQIEGRLLIRWQHHYTASCSIRLYNFGKN